MNPPRAALRRVACRAERDYLLPLANCALLVIDMQRGFLEADDAAPLRAIVPQVSAVLAAARAAGLLVLHSREGYAADGSDVTEAKRLMGYVGEPGPGGPHLIRGTPSHDFATGFEPLPSEPVIDKAGFSAFYGTELEALLRERDISHLVLMGVTTQCCVHSTLRDAVERGFLCLTLEDCCAAFEPALHEASLAIIQGEDHLFGWIAESTDFLSAIEDR